MIDKRGLPKQLTRKVVERLDCRTSRSRPQSMKVREIQGHLEEMYEAEVSSTLFSSVTDAAVVIDDAIPTAGCTMTPSHIWTAFTLKSGMVYDPG